MSTDLFQDLRAVMDAQARPDDRYILRVLATDMGLSTHTLMWRLETGVLFSPEEAQKAREVLFRNGYRYTPLNRRTAWEHLEDDVP